MSYYILPKIINHVSVSPENTDQEIKPYISFSLLNYTTLINKQIVTMFDNAEDITNNTYSETLKVFNPYEFIYSTVPGSKYSVSKLKASTNLFYDLIEIYNNFSIFDSFRETNIHYLVVSPNSREIVDCQEIFRENFKDESLILEDIHIDSPFWSNEHKFNYIFYETTNNNYFESILKVLIVVFKNQSKNGNLVVKLDHLFYKPSIDMLYILSSLYERIYIAKPNTNNASSSEKYVVCMNCLYENGADTYFKLSYLKLIVFLKKLEGKKIKQFLNFDIPYYFKTKINDINCMIGQQQLETLGQIIAISKNKNKEEKIEMIKKSNIQKSVSWCEKFKIPCNKFTEKINIFLPIVNEVNLMENK